MELSIKEIAKLLSKELISRGYIVHRYNAYSTESVYLKVDYGLCKSIRLSNHKGKHHLRYTFNVLGYINEAYEEVDRGVKRYYVPLSEWNSILDKIDKYSSTMKEKYGVNWYKKELKRYETEGKKSLGTGFWQGAYKVK